ncbi:hypothetical protein Q5752_000082 [Cryptotrichosporon argae]
MPFKRTLQILKDPRTPRKHLENYDLDIIAAFGEFVGTVIHLLLGLGTYQAYQTNAAIYSTSPSTATHDDTSAARMIGFFYTAVGFGFSLAASASVFFRFTGSIFNPSVAFALMLTGAMQPLRFILCAACQIVGGITASAILDGLTPGGLDVAVQLQAGTNRTQGLFIEMFSTCALTLAVLMLSVEKHAATPTAPFSLALTLTALILWSIQFTGASINVARAFGPAVIQGVFPNYHWIYWLGPTLGSLLAVTFYLLFKRVHYWQITPAADATDPNLSAVRRWG